MQPLKQLILLLCFLFSTNAFSHTPQWITHQTKGRVSQSLAVKIVSFVHAYSLKRDLDPDLVFRFITVESGFRYNALSKANARGYMQVVPQYHPEKIRGRNLFDLETNIEVGTAVFQEYLLKYGDVDKAIRAYQGNHRSDVYLNKIRAVKFIDYPNYYPNTSLIPVESNAVDFNEPTSSICDELDHYACMPDELRRP